MMCRHCREQLFAIHSFREESLRSIQLLDKARLLKEFPNVTFDGVLEEECVIEGTEDFKSEHSTLNEREEEGEENIEVLEEETEDEKLPFAVLPEEETVLNYGTEEIIKKEEPDLAQQAVDERGGAEWIMFEEIEITDEQEENMETIYLEEEQDSEQELDQISDSSDTIQSESPEEQNICVEADKFVKDTPPTPKNCPTCGVTSTAMVVHMRTHTKIRPFECELCANKFYTSNKLRSHIQAVHYKNKCFGCEICGKAFGLKKTLNAHMMSHLSEKSHVCTICSKSFLFRWALTKHERTHTGERPYVCTLDGCGKSFVSSSNLRQHQKTSAHWKKPLEDVCTECDKVFQSKYALRAHQKIHEQRRASTVRQQVH